VPRLNHGAVTCVERMLVRIAEDCSGGRAGCVGVRVHAAAPQTKACRSLVENVCTFSFRRTSVSRSNRRLTLLPPATLSHHCWHQRSASTDRNPVVPLPRNYACVSLGNVATNLLAKTRRRSPTNPPRTPGPSN